jgi:hypothetical protein
MQDQLEKSTPDKLSFEERVGPVRDFVARANRPGAKLTFDGVEKAGNDRMTTYAVLLYKIEGGGHNEKDSHKHPESLTEKALNADTVYAAVEIKSEAEDKPFSWYVSNVIMPYKPNTHVLARKPVDDGHGHGH